MGHERIYLNPGDKSVFLDAALEVKYIKEHAEEYQVNSDCIFGVGFSAGGHLLGELTAASDSWVRYFHTQLFRQKPIVPTP